MYFWLLTNQPFQETATIYAQSDDDFFLDLPPNLAHLANFFQREINFAVALKLKKLLILNYLGIVCFRCGSMLYTR